MLKIDKKLNENYILKFSKDNMSLKNKVLR